jgi:hypothetical protein
MSEANEMVQPTLVGMQEDLSEQQPELYSKKAIEVFSVLVAPIFGSVMFAMNLKRLNRSEGIIPVISFGVLYFAFVIYFGENVSDKVPVHIWNGGGTLVFHYYFWKKYIGDEVKFRKRKTWKPIILTTFIIVFFVWIALLNK